MTPARLRHLFERGPFTEIAAAAAGELGDLLSARLVVHVGEIYARPGRPPR